MQRVFIKAYGFMFFLIPIPLFFDFKSFSFMLFYIGDYSPFLKGSIIPLPVGALALFSAVIIGYICSIFYPKRFRNVFSPGDLLFFYVFVVLPISLYSVFVSSLSLVRLVQLLLPMVFLSIFSFPVFIKDRYSLLKYYFYGAFLFSLLHFFSILISAENFLNVNEIYEFSSFFGLLIYQSLVSYPGVLSLNLILSVAMIYAFKNRSIPYFKYSKVCIYIYILVLVYLLAASGRRAFLVEFVSFFSLVFLFAMFFMLLKGKIKKSTAYYFSLLAVFFISFFILYINTPLSDRVLISIEQNEFDSGRVGILRNAYMFFTANVSIFLFGGGASEYPGFHNYILDQIYRVGVVGLLFVYVTVALVVKKLIKVNDVFKVYNSQRLVFVVALLMSVFWQSMINASISQPYYFVNVLATLVIVFFVLFISLDKNL